MVLNCLNFCLSGNLISPSNLKESLADIVGCNFFLFITLNLSCHSHVPYRVSDEKSDGSLMGVTSYISCRFSLVPLNILPLSLIFVGLIAVCLGVFLPWFVLPWTLCFLDLVDYVLFHVREVFSYYLFKYFLRSFLSALLGTPIIQMLVCLMLSQGSLRLSSFLFIFFFLCSVLWR